MNRLLSQNRSGNRNQFSGTARKFTSCLLTYFFTLIIYAQESTFEYEVFRNNKIIGHTVVNGIKSSGKVTYRVSSEIRLTIIKEFIFRSFEETVFEKGVMTFSSVQRTLNGQKKSDRTTRLINQVYQVVNEEENKRFHSVLVMHCTNSLYLNEPVNQGQIYSEHYQQWLNISPVNAHSYKLTLPDGNYTFYHYQNGICNKIEIYQTFYNASLKLRNQGQERMNIPISSSY